jgi:hypothetical protein
MDIWDLRLRRSLDIVREGAGLGEGGFEERRDRPGMGWISWAGGVIFFRWELIDPGM